MEEKLEVKIRVKGEVEMEISKGKRGCEGEDRGARDS